MKELGLLQIAPSETVRLNTLATDMIKRGHQVVNLTAGEPVMSPSVIPISKILSSLKVKHLRYPQVSGLPQLRLKAAEWMNEENGTSFGLSNTVVAPGGKFGIFILLQAILKKGDEVLIPSPFWVSYPGMVKLFGGKAKVIKTTSASGWKITDEDIIKNSSRKTRVLILNNGTNPTGVLYTRQELSQILSAAAAKGLFVISDEVYSGLVYDGAEYVSCSEFAKHRERVAIVQSCSKNFAIPGARVGFVFAPEQVIKVLISLISQSASGVSVLSQHAALAALQNAKTNTETIRKEMQKRRDHFIRGFRKTFGADIPAPQSALYIFVPLSVFGKQHLSSAVFCEQALLKASVALVPGSAFGQEGYVRFSFGDTTQVISKAINQLSKWLSKK